MQFSPVTCPTCFQVFDVAVPGADELPTELDYDCEVCCRPMLIAFSEDGGDLLAEARGLGD